MDQESGAAVSYYNYKILLYTFLTFPPSFSSFFFNKYPYMLI